MKQSGPNSFCIRWSLPCIHPAPVQRIIVWLYSVVVLQFRVCSSALHVFGLCRMLHKNRKRCPFFKLWKADHTDFWSQGRLRRIYSWCKSSSRYLLPQIWYLHLISPVERCTADNLFQLSFSSVWLIFNHSISVALSFHFLGVRSNFRLSRFNANKQTTLVITLQTDSLTSNMHF